MPVVLTPLTITLSRKRASVLYCIRFDNGSELLFRLSCTEVQLLGSSRKTRVGVTVVVCLFLRPALAADSPSIAMTGAEKSPWIVDLEIDRTNVTSNTVQRFNNSTTTRFDTVDYTGGSATQGRVSIGRTVDWGWKGADLRIDIVPLQVSGTATARGPIVFDGALFKSAMPLDVLYQFNTYRVTYDGPVFRDQSSKDWSFRLGGTLAIRDAQIRLAEPGIRRNYVNYGPVPLLYAAVAERLSPHVTWEADLNTFPAPGGGGLLDTSARLVWAVSSRAAVFAGVRYLAGGASGDSAYDFLHTRSGLAGVRVTF